MQLGSTCTWHKLVCIFAAFFTNSAICCQYFSDSLPNDDDASHACNEDCDSPEVSNAVDTVVATNSRPNFVLLMADDMGWGDLGANWNPDGMISDTPSMDKMAAKGIRFTDFHAGASVCSPSRAALLTGRLGKRTGVIKNFNKGSVGGLPLNETTFAETFKAKGYRTGMLGKWHLGIDGPFHPINRGFDFYLGVPYSNDMGCTDPPGFNLPHCPACRKDNSTLGPMLKKDLTSSCDMALALPLLDNTDIIEQPVNMTTLTDRYVNRSEEFIKKSVSAKQPFLLYVAFTHMHVPLGYNQAKFGNTSKSRGVYGDVLREIDDAVSRIVGAVRNAGVEKDTLIWFLSDNGPWSVKCEYAGNKGPYLGEWQKVQGGGGGSAKQTVWEAGHRVPSFAVWPGRIKPGQVDGSILSALDIYPTMAAFANISLPTNRKYDGMDVRNVLLSTGKIGNRNLFHPNSGYPAGLDGDFDGVRIGQYKAIYESGGCQECGGNTGISESHNPPLIFDLKTDIQERSPLDESSTEYADVLATLKTTLSEMNSDIQKDNTTLVNYNSSRNAWPCCNHEHVACRCKD